MQIFDWTRSLRGFNDHSYSTTVHYSHYLKLLRSTHMNTPYWLKPLMSKHNQLPTSPGTNSIPSITMQSAYNQQDTLAKLYTANLYLCGTDKHKTPLPTRSAIIIITTSRADLTPWALFNVTYCIQSYTSWKSDLKSAMYDIKQTCKMCDLKKKNKNKNFWPYIRAFHHWPHRLNTSGKNELPLCFFSHQ